MAGIYGSSGGSPSQTPVYKPPSVGSLGLGSGGSYDPPKEEKPQLELGKGSIDLTDPLTSAFESIGSFGGGIAGAIGSIGPDADTMSLGQVAEDLGRIPGGVGDIELPYLGNDPNRGPARLRDALGLVGDAVSAPGRYVEREVAEARVGNETFRDMFDPRSFLPGPTGQLLQWADREDASDLPQDLQDRLDAGESVDVIADELVARGAGFSSDPGANLVGQVILDPLNLVAPGASKVAQAAKGSGVAVRAADDLSKLGLGQRSIGTIYNASTRGMTRVGSATMDKVIGPVTSGVFHTLGTKPYQRLISGAAKLDRAYGGRFQRAFDLGAAQLPRAVIAREVADDVASKLAVKGDGAAAVEARLFAKKAAYPDELERRSEELLGRVTPDFAGRTGASLAAESIPKYAAITGMSVEDASRVLGKSIDRNTARTIHLAYYGHAGGELAEIKRALLGTKVNIDVERLTVLAPDTLTDELAEQVLDGTIPPFEAVERFSVLGNHFLGKGPSDDAVLEFVEKIRDSLPNAVRLPKSGKNPLPPELQDWRIRNSEFGYELGFAPKDGWKAVVDADGNVVMSDPFIHFTTDADPVTFRNPLGRLMDSLMRGTTQTTIVQQSRERMVDLVVKAKLNIAPNQIRSIHKDILDTAASMKETPRGLIGVHVEGRPIFHEIFRRQLGEAEYAELVARYDPTYIVMKAFEGNLGTVGLTQKVTGKVKTNFPIAAKIAEHLYPKARFTYRPTFQAQEMIESPTFNALRGVTDRKVADELADAYAQLAEQPEFKYLAEANILNIAGDRAVGQFMGANTPIGRAMGRFTNIQARKETARVRQVMFEHGEDFREAVQAINPKFWRTMEEAYGTTDPRIIADRFLDERMRLASGNLDEIERMIDEAVGSKIQHLYEGNRFEEGQALNKAAGVARGGSAASGGAVLEEGAVPGRAGEMVLQAFKDSMREASNRAFRTHFFSPERGWLERTLNHPFLGLYPLSYMWGKVLPEFARFLFKRPFGVDAPLVGAVNLERVQQAYLGALADDPEFSAFMAENEDSIYFANLLFPGNPLNLTVNAPAWARHVAEDVQAGKEVTGQTVTREIADSTNYAFGPANDATQAVRVGSDLADIGQDIFANLELAARQFDGQFGAQ
jgi:hypothetical protein